MIAKLSQSPESVVREIRRKTRRKFTADEKIRIVLKGLRGGGQYIGALSSGGINSFATALSWSKEALGGLCCRGSSVEFALPQGSC